MEESHNEEPLNDLPNQHTENNNKESDILITKIINKLSKICKNQTETDEGDEGDEYEDEEDDIKWKSLEKLLESHINITNVFIELAKRGEL